MPYMSLLYHLPSTYTYWLNVNEGRQCFCSGVRSSLGIFPSSEQDWEHVESKIALFL